MQMNHVISAASANAFYNALRNRQRVVPRCNKRCYSRSVANLKVMSCEIAAQENVLWEQGDGVIAWVGRPLRHAEQWQKDFRSQTRQLSTYVTLSTRFRSHQIPMGMQS